MHGNEPKSYFNFDNTVPKVRYIRLSIYGLVVDNQYENAYTENSYSSLLNQFWMWM